jgi:hypothetical protein
MMFTSNKKKQKKAKKILALGFTEADIIDAADAILDLEVNPYINGVYHGKGRKVVKKDSKEKGKQEQKGKGDKKKKLRKR